MQPCLREQPCMQGLGVSACLRLQVDDDALHAGRLALPWTAHSEHQEIWAGPSWSSFALKVRSLLLPGFQDPYKSVLLHAFLPDCCCYFKYYVPHTCRQSSRVQADLPELFCLMLRCFVLCSAALDLALKHLQQSCCMCSLLLKLTGS
jgi:hypothetical protein